MSGFLPGKTLRGVGDHVTISSVKSSLLEGWGLDCENGDSGDGCTCGQWPSDQFLAFYWVVGWFCVEWQADKRWEIEENEGLSSHPSACKLHAHARSPACVGGSNNSEEQVLNSTWGDCSCHQVLPYMRPTTAFLISKDKSRKRG